VCTIEEFEGLVGSRGDCSEGVKVDRGGAAANLEKLWKEL
jgi:hypothetical protein